MLEVVLAGLVTGWAIAIPIGAVGALLVALTARTSVRTGSAAAMGVATVDGGYAALAVVGGAAIAARVGPYADWLQVASALVLLGIAALQGAGLLDDVASGGLSISYAVDELGVEARSTTDVGSLPDPLPLSVVLADHRAGDNSLFLYPWCPTS